MQSILILCRTTKLSLLLILASALPCLAAKGVDSTDEINSYLAAQQDNWKQKIPATGTRLFYQDADWAGLKQAVAAKPPRWRDNFFAIADKVAAEPLPVYSTPEARVGKSEGEKTLRETNEELWQRPVGDAMITLSLAAKLSDDSKYRQHLHDLVITACGFPTWGKYGPNMDLACDHVSRGIAVTWDWHKDLFTPDEQALILKTITDRTGTLFQGFATGKAFWAGDPTVNHNQNAAGALGVAGVAFFNDIPDAPKWLAAAMVDYDRMAKQSNPDGSSAEGVPYWTYGMSFVLPFIEATKKITGADSYYDLPFMKNAAATRIGVATPGLGSLPPWGDAVKKDFYGPQDLLYLMASHYHDAGAQYVADNIPFPPQGYSDVSAYTLLWYDPSIPSVAPTALDHFAPDWDVATTRSGWTDGDYYLSFKSGFTNRNHSHLDIGAFIFSFGDEWIALTGGYGKGKGEAGYWDGKGGRWDYFSCATESNSTLLINGQNQLFDPEARGTITHFLSSPGQMWVDASLTRAYANVDSIRRRLFHRRGDYILVLDDIKAPQSVKAEWLLQSGPAGHADGDKVQLPGTKGSLTAQALGPGAGFTLRAPTRPHYDVTPGSQQTFALEREGAKSTFSVILLPHPAGKAPPAFQTDLAETPGQRTITVTGPNWTDHVVVSDATMKVPIGPHSSATAQSTAWRKGEDGKICAFSLMQAEELISRVLKLDGSAVDLSLEADPAAKGSWTLDLGTAFEGTLEPAGSLQLFDATGKAVTPGHVSLAAGHYTLHT